MDFFSVYNLPVSFSTDPDVVKKKYYELSKRYHPDFYINEPEEKQQEVLELSTINNKAYQTLSDPQKRLQYILELKGMIHEGESYALPQEFLMEMMEINEALMDLQFEPNAQALNALRDQVAQVEAVLTDELQRLTTAFDAAEENQREDILLAIKDLYYRNKYLYRLMEGISKAEREG